jgi:beta-glucosidase-like glycosyl hydrolase
VFALTSELRERSAHPLLIGADLERGAGQQFRGATPLPPLAAIGALDDENVTRRAGELTGREALALGVNWVYAPVADVDFEPRNPIVGTRSFGTDPERVGRHVAAWIRGCHDAGALACAKHFPGHGRTTTDSHAELPVVTADSRALQQDLAPFRAAIEARVDSIMSAHVSFPALDPSGTAATLSAPILQNILRDRLGFKGLVVTDALIMEGVLEAGAGEASAVVRAVRAGCDALLYPTNLEAVATALQRAAGHELARERVQQAAERIAGAAEKSQETKSTKWGHSTDREWALQVAQHAIQQVRGAATVPRELELFVVDDDLGGPYPPPPRAHFTNSLRAAGFEVKEAVEPTSGSVVAVYCDIRAWKRRPGLSEQSIAAVNDAVARGASLVVLFGHPRLAGQFKGDTVVSAWGGEPLMQEAAAHWLRAQRAN